MRVLDRALMRARRSCRWRLSVSRTRAQVARLLCGRGVWRWVLKIDT
jgi:hypothetical protein